MRGEIFSKVNDVQPHLFSDMLSLLVHPIFTLRQKPIVVWMMFLIHCRKVSLLLINAKRLFNIISISEMLERKGAAKGAAPTANKQKLVIVDTPEVSKPSGGCC